MESTVAPGNTHYTQPSSRGWLAGGGGAVLDWTEPDWTDRAGGEGIIWKAGEGKRRIAAWSFHRHECARKQLVFFVGIKPHLNRQVDG